MLDDSFSAPASEIWGRSIIFHVSNVLFLAFSVGCALAPSMPSMLAFRFFAGCAGAAPLAVGSGTIADMIPREKRGSYFAVFATGGQLAPLIGPVIGGAMEQKLSWRWTFWLITIIVRLLNLRFAAVYATHVFRSAWCHHSDYLCLSARNICPNHPPIKTPSPQSERSTA
jgi:MFS family permease